MIKKDFYGVCLIVFDSLQQQLSGGWWNGKDN